MPTSAFKKDSTATAQPPSRRRSHSVSAASRKPNIKNQETSSISNDLFSNSRDNPLFWSTSPPDKDGTGNKSANGLKNNSLGRKSIPSLNSSSSVGSCEERGRSVSRNGQVKRGIGRSLSRGHHKDLATSSIDGIKRVGNSVTRSNSVRNTFDAKGSVENSRVKKIPNRAADWSEDDSACSLRASNFEDEVSNFSLSEVDEKLIDAVCEDFNAFLSNDVHTLKAINVADTPPDMVKPGAVELISDIRREYAAKLEQSEERARKLREDLAIEEQQRHELDRVLKEIIPDPNTSSVQRPRRGRRRSNERRKMSRCLTDEAMAYFDECVSLSTFDSSDFSASEDPLFTSSSFSYPAHASSPVKDNLSTVYSYDQDILRQEELQMFDSHVQPLFICEDPGMTINNSITESGSAHQYELPFVYANQQPKNVGPHEDISSFVKHFEKSNVKDTNRSCYDADGYAANGTLESMLIDRVLYNNRIETGGLHLCGGAISFLPFASLF